MSGIHPYLSRILSIPLLLITLFAALPANANSLSTQLSGLVDQGDSLDLQLSGINLTSGNSCAELGSSQVALNDLIASIESVSAGLTAPLSLTTADLDSLDDLSTLSLSLGNSLKAMSLDVNNIANLAELFEYQSSLSAMLQLSADIGTMADRILEMANKILVMADNIGLMADRILITMTLQNTNIALTQATMLATQQNMIALSGTLSTLGFNALLSSLLSDSNVLSNTMLATSLTETNMASQLSALAATSSTALSQVDVIYQQIISNSENVSYYINGDTLTLLGDLSVVHQGLAQSLESYSQAINTLAPLTSTPILSDATASMLVLANDIGIMSNRIMEMVDNIIIMADNIGEMSTRIVETETIQQTNVTLTQNSLTTATTTTVGVIASYGL